MKKKGATNTSEIDNFILVGLKNEWDTSKCPKFKQINPDAGQGGDIIYGISAVTTLPLERFQIVHATKLWNERYYPQGNKGSVKFTRALKGDNRRGDGVNWEIRTTAGQKIAIYFSPSEGSCEWRLGDLDLDYVPPPPRVTADHIWAATQFEIEPDNDSLCKVLLAAASPLALRWIGLYHCLPYVIMLLMNIWVTYVAPNQINIGLYQSGMYLEWLNVAILYGLISLPKWYGIMDQFKVVTDMLAFAPKLDDPKLARRFRIAAYVNLMNLLQPVFAITLSVYIALWLSENIFLNVVLNILALEFITDLDDDMIATAMKNHLGKDSMISLVILDVTYAVHEENEFWKENEMSRSAIIDTLKSDDADNQMRSEALTSPTRGLGLLGTLRDGRECVSHVKLRLQAVNWKKITEKKIKEDGWMYMTSLNTGTWNNVINKRQKGLLFKHHPSFTIHFPWRGCVKLDDLDLDPSCHASPLAHIIRHNGDEVTELDLGENPQFCSTIETMKMLRSELRRNKTLKKLSLRNCQLDDDAAMAFGKLLKDNTSLEYCWLSDNNGITDKGARGLMDALVLKEGEGGNMTLNSLYMKGCGVSEECQVVCQEKTNGRMEFT